MEHPDLNIANIVKGAVPEVFDRALGEVLANMADPNTPYAGKRSIVLTFDFTPDKTRESARVQVKCATKLSGKEPDEGHVFIVRRQGKVTGIAHDPQQLSLLREPTATDSAQ